LGRRPLAIGRPFARHAHGFEGFFGFSQDLPGGALQRVEHLLRLPDGTFSFGHA